MKCYIRWSCLIGSLFLQALRTCAFVAPGAYQPSSLALTPSQPKNKFRVEWHHDYSSMAQTLASPKQQSTTTTSTSLSMMGTMAKTLVMGLRAGAPAAVEVSDIIACSYDWCINLGNPSALVAGAVIATIYENMSSGTLDVEKKDRPLVRFGKRMTRVLLLSAFALEVMSIFVTTVMGTMLLSQTLDHMDELSEVTMDTRPLSFLQENFEFEFLTARITFLQGLLNWLGAIALGHFIPSKGQNKDARNMNKFIGCALMTSIIVMLSFYNRHMTFYNNYGHMLVRFIQCTLERFVFCWPVRPLSFVYVPVAAATAFFGIKAFFDAGHDDDDDDDDDDEVDETAPKPNILAA